MAWREIDNLGEFLRTVRKSKPKQECVLVAIMRDLLDLRRAFAAGVHYLIHKPASSVQIERCLRAAYRGTVARRRKQHCEPVRILATVSTPTQPFTEASIVNLGEGGLGLPADPRNDLARVLPNAGEEVDIRFALPGGGEILHTAGRVVWTTLHSCGVQCKYIPEDERLALEPWMTAGFERSLAELCGRMLALCA